MADYIWVKITDGEKFDRLVFGAADFRQKCPKLFTGAFKVIVQDSFFYPCDDRSEIISMDQFFDVEEVRACMQVINPFQPPNPPHSSVG